MLRLATDRGAPASAPQDRNADRERLKRRDRCLDLAARTGIDAGDIVSAARQFEAYLNDADAVRSPEVEELIAAARCACTGDEGWGIRLRAALQTMGELR